MARATSASNFPRDEYHGAHSSQSVLLGQRFICRDRNYTGEHFIETTCQYLQAAAGSKVQSAEGLEHELDEYLECRFGSVGAW